MKWLALLFMFSQIGLSKEKPSSLVEDAHQLFQRGYYFTSYEVYRMALENRSGSEALEKILREASLVAEKYNKLDEFGGFLASQITLNKVPNGVKSIYQYAVGVNRFKKGEIEAARSFFRSISRSSAYYSKAQIYLGIAATQRKNYAEATRHFENAVEESLGNKNLFSQNELARLNLARTQYSRGQVESSIHHYAQFLSSSPYFLTILLEASWPLLKVNDSSISLGNLHTVTSPFYREDLVGEAYILKATILYTLCKYAEMRNTLDEFFALYEPILKDMQKEAGRYGESLFFYEGLAKEKGLNAAFVAFAKRDVGVKNSLRAIDAMQEELAQLDRLPSTLSNYRGKVSGKLSRSIEEEKRDLSRTLQKLHQQKLKELKSQKDEASYLKVEVVTSEKDFVESQSTLPGKKMVEVDANVSKGYQFWPFEGEYWEDELGAYVYTTETACSR